MIQSNCNSEHKQLFPTSLVEFPKFYYTSISNMTYFILKKYTLAINYPVPVDVTVPLYD